MSIESRSDRLKPSNSSRRCQAPRILGSSTPTACRTERSALGILTAATQLADRKRAASFVGIEEPETALHPAAAGALIGALREAAVTTQVVITTHSPDLVDQMVLGSDAVLTVQSNDGETNIAPMDPASREAIETHLYTAGELLRMDQLEPDKANLEEQRQMTLFGANGEEE